MIDLLRLCRLYYAIPMALTYVLTVYYARGGEMAGQWAETLRSGAALALIIAAAYVLNDVCDVAVDHVNAPQRPLASGRVRRKTAAILAALLALTGAGLGTTARPAFLLVLLAVAAGLAVYDVFSKRLGIAKQIVVAALMTSIYPLALAQAGGATGRRAWTLAVFPAWMFLTALGYELLKDIRDVPGDQAVIESPNLVQRNPLRWRAVANSAIIVGGLLLIGPRFLGCGQVYTAVAAGAIGVAVGSKALAPRAAIRAVYTECVIVGIAATLDVIVAGV
jgi:geranylgeranylglycerol-phosphate geranylgeranyltransferase